MLEAEEFREFKATLGYKTSSQKLRIVKKPESQSWVIGIISVKCRIKGENEWIVMVIREGFEVVDIIADTLCNETQIGKRVF